MNLNTITKFVKKHEHPKHLNNQVPSDTTVYCPVCDWTGTVEQSLVLNPNDDTCPKCGNQELGYEI